MKFTRTLAAAGLAMAGFAATPLTASALTPGDLGDGNGDGYADVWSTQADNRYKNDTTYNGTTWYRPRKTYVNRYGQTVPINDWYNTDAYGNKILWNYLDKDKQVIKNVGLGTADAMVALPDMTGDKKADSMARFGDHLYFYTNKGTGEMARSYEIGHGWGAMDTVIFAGKLNGDSQNYLLARNSTDKALYAYKLYAGGAIKGVGKVGSNWGQMRFLLGPGQTMGDSKADLIGINANGTMYCYTGVGGGKIAGGVACGSGWDKVRTAFIAGDMNGDGRYDLVSVFPSKNPVNGDIWQDPTMPSKDMNGDGKINLEDLGPLDRSPMFMYYNKGGGKWGDRVLIQYDDFQYKLFA